MKKITISLFGIALVATVLIAPPFTTKSAPAVAIVAAIVTTVSTAVLVYDYNSCDLHVVWGCDDDNGGGGNGNNNGGSGGGGGNGAGANNNGGNNGNGGGSFTGEACSSAPNSCGLVSNGFENAQGVCAATPPSASSCPSPTFAEDLTAEPDLVRKGETAVLSWDVSDATACSLNGGGLNLMNLDFDDSQETGAIENRTEFTLTCANGDIAEGAPTVSQTEVVNIVPEFQEI